MQDDGNVQVKLRTRWSDGTTHLLFTAHELLEKLAALIPPPRAHLVRWSGAFALASPLRKMITLDPDKKKAFQFSEDDHSCQESKSSDSWARLLKRVLKVDVTTFQIDGRGIKLLIRQRNSELKKTE